MEDIKPFIIRRVKESGDKPTESNREVKYLVSQSLSSNPLHLAQEEFTSEGDIAIKVVHYKGFGAMLEDYLKFLNSKLAEIHKDDYFNEYYEKIAISEDDPRNKSFSIIIPNMADKDTRAPMQVGYYGQWVCEKVDSAKPLNTFTLNDIMVNHAPEWVLREVDSIINDMPTYRYTSELINNMDFSIPEISNDPMPNVRLLVAYYDKLKEEE